LFETVWFEIRSAMRTLRRSPGFSLKVILPIALGISCSTIVFSVFDAAVLRALPYPEAHQLVVIESNIASFQSYHGFLALADMNDIQRQATSFEAIGSFKKGAGVNLSGEGRFDSISNVLVSSDFFKTIGAAPLLGRWLVPEDNDPANSLVAVISYSLWRTSFASDPGVIGLTVKLDNKPFTIVGVMGPEFRFPSASAQIWIPEPHTPDALTDRMGRDQSVIARLRPGVKPEGARAEFLMIGNRIGREFPEGGADLKLTMGSLQDQVVGPVKNILTVLFGAALSVLLIACANVANLFLVRNVTRQREIAVRLAHGATRVQVFRQLLAESVLLACLGGGFGVIICTWGLHLLRTIGPAYFDQLRHVALNPTVLGYAFCASLVTGVVFGTVPAWLAATTDLNTSLKNGSWNSRSADSTLWSRGLRNVFVIAQVTMAVVLAMSSAWMLRSFVHLATVKLGFEPANLQVIQLSSRTGGPGNAFFREVSKEANSLPGVESTALVSNTPFSGFSTSITLGLESSRTGWVMGPSIEFREISPGYFQTMGIPVLQGRDFNDGDKRDSPCVVMVNDQMAHDFWPDGDVLSRRIDLNGVGKGERHYCAIVGVAGNSRDIALEKQPGPEIYFPDLQFSLVSFTLLIRSRNDISLLASSLLPRVQEHNRSERFLRAVSVEELIEHSIVGPRFRAELAGFFAALALILGAVGVYGVTTYSVSRRTHEIGIRIAFGAQAADILKAVLRESLLIVAVGTTLGIVLAFSLGQIVESLLFDVKRTDTVSFLTVISLILSACFLASYLPARHATKIDPKTLLRYE